MDRLLPPGSAGVRYGAERGAQEQERLIRVISATWATLLGHRCLDTRHMQNIHTHPYKARMVHDILISNLSLGCLHMFINNFASPTFCTVFSAQVISVVVQLQVTSVSVLI